MQGIIGGTARTGLPQTLELEDFVIYRHNGATANAKPVAEETAGDHQAGLVSEQAMPDTEARGSEISPAERQRIQARLNYRYPEADDNVLPSKMSVTEIKNLQTIKVDQKVALQSTLPPRSEGPKFMAKQQDAFSPAQRGSALHLLLEVIDLAPLRAPLSSQGSAGFAVLIRKHLEAEISRLVENAFLPEKLANTINLENAAAFYASPVGIRLLSAEKIRREIPFNYAYEPGAVRAEWAGIKEKIIVQGIIDCAFIEDGQWVIVDYKTDFYRDQKQRAELLAAYGIQINLYAQALTALSGLPVKETIIAFITMQENISC